MKRGEKEVIELENIRLEDVDQLKPGYTSFIRKESGDEMRTDPITGYYLSASLLRIDTKNKTYFLWSGKRPEVEKPSIE